MSLHSIMNTLTKIIKSFDTYFDFCNNKYDFKRYKIKSFDIRRYDFIDDGGLLLYEEYEAFSNYHGNLFDFINKYSDGVPDLEPLIYVNSFTDLKDIEYKDDIRIDLGDIYFLLSDIEEYEKNNQPKPATNQDDGYKYSEALKPYNDIILAFADCEDYKKKGRATQSTNHIQPWLKENYLNKKIINTDDIRVLVKFIKAHYNIN